MINTFCPTQPRPLYGALTAGVCPPSPLGSSCGSFSCDAVSISFREANCQLTGPLFANIALGILSCGSSSAGVLGRWVRIRLWSVEWAGHSLHRHQRVRSKQRWLQHRRQVTPALNNTLSRHFKAVRVLSCDPTLPDPQVVLPGVTMGRGSLCVLATSAILAMVSDVWILMSVRSRMEVGDPSTEHTM